MLKQKIVFTSEKKFEVWYDKALCGEFRVDLLVENKVIFELKALEELNAVHAMPKLPESFEPGLGCVAEFWQAKASG